MNLAKSTMKLLANYKKVSILIMIDAFAMAMATQLTLFQRSFQMIESEGIPQFYVAVGKFQVKVPLFYIYSF